MEKIKLQLVISIILAFSLFFASPCSATSSTTIFGDSKALALGAGGAAAALLLFSLSKNSNNGNSNTSNNLSHTITTGDGIPVILSESSYNSLYIKNAVTNNSIPLSSVSLRNTTEVNSGGTAIEVNSGGTAIPIKIYVLNNSDQTVINGFDLIPSSANIVVSPSSTCFKKVGPHDKCYFEITSTDNKLASAIQIDRTPVTLSVVSGTNNNSTINNGLLNPANTGIATGVITSEINNPTTITTTETNNSNSTDSITINKSDIPYGHVFDPTVDSHDAHGVDATKTVYSFATITKNGINFVYVATENGVFKTSDNGLTWILVTNGLTNKNVRALYVIGSDLYAATIDNTNITDITSEDLTGKVFKTSDGGTNWTPLTLDGLKNTNVRALCSLGNYLYVGTMGGGVFKLDITNPKAIWEHVGSEPIECNNEYVYALHVVGDTLYAGFEYYDYTDEPGYCDTFPDSDGMVYKLVDSNWLPVGKNLGGVYALNSYGNYLYATSWTGGNVFRISLDGGTAWEQFGSFPTSIKQPKITIDYIKRLFLSIVKKKSSINNIKQNIAILTALDLETNNGVSALNIVNDVLYVGTNNSGVFKIDINADPKTTYTPINTGFRGNNLPTIYTLHTTISNMDNNLVMYAGLRANTGSASGGIYTTTPQISPNTENWTFVSNTLTLKTVYALATTNTGVIYAGVYGDGVFASYDGGATWTPLTNNGLTNLNIITLALLDDYLYAGVKNHTTATTDLVFRININSGNAWESVSNDLGKPYCSNERKNCKLTVKTLHVTNNIMYAGVYDKKNNEPGGGVYRFDSNLLTWKYIPGLQGKGKTKAMDSFDNTFWASSYYKGDRPRPNPKQKVVYSNTTPPKAYSWTQLDQNTNILINKNILSLKYNPNDKCLYAGSAGGEIFKIDTQSQSPTWANISPTIIMGNPVNTLCIYKNKTYAGIGLNKSGGIYVYEDQSSTWIPIPTDNDIKDINVLALQNLGNNLLVGTSGHGMLKTINE